jgi:hypothetical protein
LSHVLLLYFRLSKTGKAESQFYTSSQFHFQINELDRIKNISEREKAARKIIDQLLNFTNLDKMNEEERGNEMKQQDLNDTVRILQKIIHSNISNSLNILGPANNILYSRNTKSWRNMTVSY